MTVTFKCPDIDKSVDLFSKGLIDELSQAGHRFGLKLDQLQIILDADK